MSEIKVIKMRSGGENIWLSLEDNQGGQMPRSFNLVPNRDTVIPFQYAMTLFTYGGIEAMYRNNEFLITAGEEELFKALEGDSLTPNVIDKADDEKILTTLRSNNITEMKKLLESDIGSRTKDLIIENLESLPVAVVKELEKYTGLIMND